MIEIRRGQKASIDMQENIEIDLHPFSLSLNLRLALACLARDESLPNRQRIRVQVRPEP